MPIVAACGTNSRNSPSRLGFHCGGQDIHPGGVAARPVIARRETQLDRIASNEKDDRYRRSRSLGCERRGLATGGGKNSHWTTRQFCCHRRQPVVLAKRPAVFDHHILAFDETALAKTSAERRH